MERSSLRLGKPYAYRRLRQLAGPVLKVVPLQLGPPKTHKVRVRFEDGDYPGLDQWVSIQHVLCPWGQRERLIRDERHLLAVREGPDPPDKITAVAVDLVLESTGEGLSAGTHGTGACEPAVLERVMARAGLTGRPPSDLDRRVFVDRHGRVHLPWLAWHQLAVAFAAAEPETVLQEVRREKVALESGPIFSWRTPMGEDDARARRPVHALVRDWALGEDAEGRRADETERLRVLLRQAATRLEELGAVRSAWKLRAELGDI